jgi:hypothetical protein
MGKVDAHHSAVQWLDSRNPDAVNRLQVGRQSLKAGALVKASR